MSTRGCVRAFGFADRASPLRARAHTMITGITPTAICRPVFYPGSSRRATGLLILGLTLSSTLRLTTRGQRHWNYSENITRLFHSTTNRSLSLDFRRSSHRSRRVSRYSARFSTAVPCGQQACCGSRPVQSPHFRPLDVCGAPNATRTKAWHNRRPNTSSTAPRSPRFRRLPPD
jgi:hypothetical protein